MHSWVGTGTAVVVVCVVVTLVVVALVVVAAQGKTVVETLGAGWFGGWLGGNFDLHLFQEQLLPGQEEPQ
jgi:hypothetical protein